MKKITKACFVVLGLMAGTVPAFAQAEQQDLYDMPLEELLNISIVSASKEKERQFDAPLAAYSITRDEIAKAGVWSIPEALRLIPGVIVRETSNGVYDVHLRGFDNTTKYTLGINQINTLTLVMINNRPVFNYNLGGTAWDALPIDLADVERIEVVCGPSAPLFGPNAVTGVINIITREFKQHELLVSGQLQGSLPSGSMNGSIAAGRQLGSKFSLGVSGNYQKNNRLDDEQFIYASGDRPAFYMKSSDFQAERVKALGLDPEVAIERSGLNAYATYNPSERVSFEFSSGMQSAESQKVFLTMGTPLSYSGTTSYYGNLNSKINDLSLRLSYLKGEDDVNKLNEYVTSSYDFRIMDVAADYDLKLHNKLRIRPSLGYQSTRYNDLEQSRNFPFGGLIQGDHSMHILSGSLRADYTPLKGLRLIGSSRFDKFDVSDDTFVSYQFASTYAINERWMLRAVHAKSLSGIFYSNAFVNTAYGVGANTYIRISANGEVRPGSNTMTELGLRAQLLSNLQLDLSLFSQRLEDASVYVFKRAEMEGDGLFLVNQPDNVPYTAHQHGLSASVTWVPSRQWQIRPFITLQETELRNFDYYNNPTQTGVAYQGRDVKHENTPALFGGWYVNWSPTAKLNVNTSAYYFSKHTMSAQQDVAYTSEDGRIAGKMLLNARVSYQVYKKLGLFAGAKNLLNQDNREYYGTDRMGRQYFSGISYNM
ncbi:TonB-dependent siderophore receptor [Cesiribacter sp. SM1]|uniref:TonB-dependent receptor plug domain-containing protein n=1 Tax=Cesiribacter sp. SM1 TaxID=2861196 RepID=UPI001CD3F254|nr:TonB-dependent receptor plug domain-containing protein [Cesiribacter sp. SM1]